MTVPRYWRIRGRYGDEDLSEKAWDRNECGIWYGAWTPEDWREAMLLDGVKKQRAFLADLPTQKRLELETPSWASGFTKSCFDTARRFAGITEADWVVFYFRQGLHLARLQPELESSPTHELNRGLDLFKYRRIIAKKSFPLTSLPDAYRLVPPAG